MSFAQRLRARREQLGLTQTELAHRCGWQQGRIGNYERGERERVAVRDVQALARALDCTPEFLQWGVAPDRLSDEEWSLIHAYRSLPRPDREHIRALLHRVAEAAPGYTGGTGSDTEKSR